MQQSDCLFFFPFSFVPPLHEPVHLHPFHHTIHWLPKIIVNSLLVLLVNDLSPFSSGPPLPMLLLLHRNQKNRTQLLAMVPHGLILHFDHNHYYYYYYYSTTHNYIVTVLNARCRNRNRRRVVPPPAKIAKKWRKWSSAVFEFSRGLYENIQLDLHHATNWTLVRVPTVPHSHASGVSRFDFCAFSWNYV